MWASWPFARVPVKPPTPVGMSEIRPCGDCLRCVAACPSGALVYQRRKWQLDLSHCIFCRSCAQICPNPLIGAK